MKDTVRDMKKSEDALRDLVYDARTKGNVVIVTLEGVMTTNLKDFVEQPADGILYDLNRDEVTTMSLAGDGLRWINDFAAAQVIRELKAQIAQLKEGTCGGE